MSKAHIKNPLLPTIKRIANAVHSLHYVVRVVAPALLLAGCTTRYTPNALDPAGPGAENIADLGWFSLLLGTAIYIGVMLIFVYAIRQGRKRTENDTLPGNTQTWVILGGIVFPLLTGLILFGYTVATLRAVAEPDEVPALTIEVIGHRWWWEIRYPGFTTANEIHIPVGQPVEVIVTSVDVIHSFWVPQLYGKIDLMPGEFNEIWIEADEVGVYWGECAEFCGIQHAKMNFLVIAEPPGQFLEWAENQRQPAVDPASALAQQGQEVFLNSACAECHTIRGTSAQGKIGPDLTHLASRRTIGAATVEFNTGNLGGWIINSQDIKPGNYMPPFRMPGDTLLNLIRYLESLQ